MKLLVDFMCGKLARWLRVLGVDAEYSRETEPGKLIKRALSEERTLVTRNRTLPHFPDVKIVVLESEKPREQVKQVIKDLGLAGCMAPFTRCSVCNGRLEHVEKEDVRGRIPFYTFKTQDRFKKCPGCGRIYWEGTHVSSMKERVGSILREAGIDEYE